MKYVKLFESFILEAKVNEGYYSSSDIKKLKEFAEETSEEIKWVYAGYRKFKSREFSAKKMLDYILAWGEMKDLTADEVISTFDYTSKDLERDLGLAGLDESKVNEARKQYKVLDVTVDGNPVIEFQNGTSCSKWIKDNKESVIGDVKMGALDTDQNRIVGTSRGPYWVIVKPDFANENFINEASKPEKPAILVKLFKELSKAKNVESLSWGYDADEEFPHVVKFENGLEAQSPRHDGELEQFSFYLNDDGKTILGIYDLSGYDQELKTVKDAVEWCRANEY